jgi:hypothetical protein
MTDFFLKKLEYEAVYTGRSDLVAFLINFDSLVSFSRVCHLTACSISST